MKGASKRGRHPAVHGPVELRGSRRSEEEAQAAGRVLFAVEGSASPGPGSGRHPVAESAAISAHRPARLRAAALRLKRRG